MNSMQTGTRAWDAGYTGSPDKRKAGVESPLSVALNKLQMLARWAEVPDGFYNGVSSRTLREARVFLFSLSCYNLFLSDVADVAVSGISVTYTLGSKSLVFYIHERGPEFFCQVEAGKKAETKAFMMEDLSACLLWLLSSGDGAGRQNYYTGLPVA